MSEHIWLSQAATSTQVNFGFGWPFDDFDLAKYVEVANALQVDANAGNALPPDRFPARLEAAGDGGKGPGYGPAKIHGPRLPAKLPHLIKWTWPVVSKQVADVLRGFDLGASNLYPVDMFRHDKGVVYDQEFFILNIGVAKKTIVPDQSQGLKEHRGLEVYYELRATAEDDFVVVERSAADGPDLWIDPCLSYGVYFMTERLQQALSAAGVSKDLGLLRCRIA